jgi:deoxyadenosine/deoxycytidine kinase
MRRPYLVVTGAIAAGATTLSNAIMDRYDVVPFLEEEIQVSNPFFQGANEGKQRWPFYSQVHFALASVDRHARLSVLLSNGGPTAVVEDRTPFEHDGAYRVAYERLGRLTGEEAQVISAVAREAEKDYLVPDLLVYREMSEEQLVSRVKERNRASESKLDLPLLKEVHRAFEELIVGWDRSRLVRIPSDVDVLTDSGAETAVSLVVASLELVPRATSGA